MKINNPFITLAIVSLVTISVGGCAKYATSDKKIAAIEKRVSVGMTESEFTESVPNAELITTTENKSVYAVRVSPPCFICRSTKSFTRSFESYATQFVFENGELVAFNRFLDGE
jgi:hypothetical protein